MNSAHKNLIKLIYYAKILMSHLKMSKKSQLMLN